MTSGPHWSAAGECVNWSRETGRAGRTGSREMGLARAGLGSGAVEWAARRGVWLGRDDRAAARVAGPKGKGVRVGPRRGKGQAGLGFGFFSLFPSLFLVQTNTQLGEFKFKFEFTTSTQTNKLMHQHECNN